MEHCKSEIDGLFEELVTLRRRLHAHPELGFELPETVRALTAALTRHGIPFVIIEGAGILAQIGRPEGPAILLRADLDALPLEEATAVPYRSQNENKMHACGHDLHAAILLGAGILLKKRENQLPGCVKLLFQPDEEGLTGARRMIEAGVLEAPAVQAVVGLHVVPGVFLETGEIIGQSGPVMAGSIPFEIEITGQGGHGSAPENAIDPIYAAVQIYQSLQSIKMREVSAQEPLVMTIGEFAFGKACNVIPQSGRMSGTLRFFKKEVGAQAIERIEEIVQAMAPALRVEAVVKRGVFVPPVVNDEALAHRLLPRIQAALGEDRVRDFQHRFMSSEDFAFFGEKVPSLYLNMGAGSRAAGYAYSLHHPKVEFDEGAIKYGVAALTSAAQGFFEEVRG